MEVIMDQLSVIARNYWGAWLMLLFIGVIIYAYSPSRKAAMERYGHIPLNDDTPPDVEA